MFDLPRPAFQYIRITPSNVIIHMNVSAIYTKKKKKHVTNFLAAKNSTADCMIGDQILSHKLTEKLLELLNSHQRDHWFQMEMWNGLAQCCNSPVLSIQYLFIFEQSCNNIFTLQQRH